MYKVFFQDRIIYLTDDFSSNFFKSYGLFYKYYDPNELADLLKLFFLVTKIKKLYIFHGNLDLLAGEFYKQFKLIEAGGGLVLNDSGEIMVIERRGKWDLPKGKFKSGETPGEAALRETEEEVGLSDLILNDPFSTTYHIYFENQIPVLKKTYWFRMKTSGLQEPVPQEEEEITRAIWMAPADLQKIVGNTYLSVVDVLMQANLLKFSAE